MSQTEPVIRAFIAIEVPTRIERALAQAQSKLRQTLDFRSLRWVDAANIHVTLKFLGDVRQDQIASIQSALAEVAGRHSMFSLTAAGLGAFPSPDRASVLWAGLEGEIMQLHRLRDDVERAIAPLGFPTENRRFSPHLTLARVKEPLSGEARRIGEVVRANPIGLLGEFRVADISLMRSDLSPEGARYTRLAFYDLLP